MGGPVAAEVARDVYEAQHVRLWRAVASWSGSSDVADEAVAEAFAQLLRRGDAVVDPAAWAWRTAFRIAAAQLKRRQAEPTHAVIDVQLPGVEAEVVLDVMRSLQRLSDQQRACVVVCDLLGYSAEEAAPLLNTSPATVRVQRMRARRRMRALLEVHDV